MSRLVDIDDVKALINGLDSLPWEEEVDDLVNSIPTAFDMEKVVEQLEEKQYAYLHDNGDYEEGKYYAFEEAIDIVKKGGVE